MILGINGIIASGKTGFDIDAQAFITAAGITDTTQKNAVNQLVKDLKQNSIYNKFIAIYPFVGGTASSHRFNLKDPRIVSGAYYLNFYGGGTHSANGYQPDGATAYADTQLNASTIATASHLSYYSRTSAIGVQIEMGYYDGVSSLFNQLRPAVNYISGSIASILPFTSTSNAQGFWIGSRRADNDREIYKNGISETTSTVTDANSNPSKIIYIAARNEDSGPNFFSTKECAFASIGHGLSDSEATALYNAVQTFQTTLGRQV